MPLAPEDEIQMMHIIQESLSNIRKHAQAAHVQVSLHRRQGRVEIVVEDDGEGLIAGETEKIFERFSRGGAAGRRSGQEGAGLGLALALEHVTLHGGRIWAENRTDGIRGARFVVELPVEIQPQETSQTP